MKPVLRLLGRFDLATGDGVSVVISGTRAQLLLARLAMARGAGLHRAMLCSMFWADRAEAQARASLRQTIWSLRQELKTLPDALVASGEILRLDPALIACDLDRFEQLAASEAAPDLETALALYRGEFLEGHDLIGLAPEADFLPERNRLRDLALKVAGNLAGHYARSGAWEDVVQVARRGLGIDSFDEVLHVRLIDGLHRLGRPREARDQDAAFRSRMQAELGVTLAPQTRREVRAGPTLAAPAPPATQVRPVWVNYAAGLTVAAFCVAFALAIWRPAPETLAAAPTSQSSGSTSRNLEAYDLYLRAEAARLTAIEDDKLRDVMSEFRRAFTLDPNFAAAYAGYAMVAVDLWQRSLDLGTPSLSARIETYETAGRALAIDPGNALALVVLSRIQAEDGVQENALATARLAVENDPQDAETHANLAHLLANSEDYTHARAELMLLQRLNPAHRPAWRLIFGQIAFGDGRYDGAIADLINLWPTIPDNIQMLQHLAAALALQGRIRQANEIRHRLMAVMPNANLQMVALRYADRRSPSQIARLIEGLRRAGLPEWPHGFDTTAQPALNEPDLAALVAQGDWQGATDDGRTFALSGDGQGGLRDAEARYVMRGASLCRGADGGLSLREICGSVFRARPGQVPDSDFVLVAPDGIRYFSLAK